MRGCCVCLDGVIFFVVIVDDVVGVDVVGDVGLGLDLFEFDVNGDLDMKVN